jgi:hypothetical protein
MGAKHLSPSTIRLYKTILSAIFTTALKDQVTVLHPCQGTIKTPPIPRQPLRIITPQEFERFHRSLPDAESQDMPPGEVEPGGQRSGPVHDGPPLVDHAVSTLHGARSAGTHQKTALHKHGSAAFRLPGCGGTLPEGVQRRTR